MSNRTITRRLAAVAVGIFAAPGIVLAAAVIASPAGAGAQPGDSGQQCASMTMTDARNAPGPSGMTRAGQIAAAQPDAGGSSMTAGCQPASHG